MASAQHHIKLALSLPPRLRTFFARYPPQGKQTAYQKESTNPFARTYLPVTGKWHDPKYSMRQQAELCKIAREHGVEELLPPSPKNSVTRLVKRVTLGLRVKGTGVGQKVKGHKHERHMVAKMEKRRKAMVEMPDLIREWKKVGKRNWTRWPKRGSV
ncbi:hypothetical protein QBC39DRAFT_340628 [Podospora conica]|nr:hypothetical protein QBC39DRAFT_340628 [Schizothecium conicum]